MIGSRIIPVIFIIAAVALFLVYVQPTYSGSIAMLSTEIKDLDTALDAARSFKDKEVALTQERNSLSAEQLTRLEAFLPDSVDNVQLIVDLNSLAARSGVTLSDFSIEGDSAAGDDTAPVAEETTLALDSGEPTDTLELSVAATGSYEAFRTFLAGVEQSLRPLDIIELTVEDSETGVYTYDITFRIYWLR
jgi:Tfp pilus assembly protein PilO